MVYNPNCEYKGNDDRYHPYFPDFVLVKKTSEFYIIEVKAERDREDKIVVEKKKAAEKLQKTQPEKFKYHVVYTSTSTIGTSEMKPISDWVGGA